MRYLLGHFSVVSVFSSIQFETLYSSIFRWFDFVWAKHRRYLEPSTWYFARSVPPRTRRPPKRPRAYSHRLLHRCRHIYIYIFHFFINDPTTGFDYYSTDVTVRDTCAPTIYYFMPPTAARRAWYVRARISLRRRADDDGIIRQQQKNNAFYFLLFFSPEPNAPPPRMRIYVYLPT